MKAIDAIRARLQRQGRPRIWGLAAAVATTLLAVLAVLAALVWLERPAPAPHEGASLPRVSGEWERPSWRPATRIG